MSRSNLSLETIHFVNFAALNALAKARVLKTYKRNPKLCAVGMTSDEHRHQHHLGAFRR